MKKFSFILTSTLSAAVLASCTPNVPTEKLIEANGQYWQRIDVASALYLRGPKAQQTLNEDIARCVTDINTLARVGAIKEGFPADRLPNGRIPDEYTPEGQLARWNTPKKDGNKYYEHLQYHDFEGCMTFKGWERIKYVPYGVSEEAKNVYYEVMIGERRRTKAHQKTDEPFIKPKKDSAGFNE